METRQRNQSAPEPWVLFQCRQGHMVTPAAMRLMERHNILCPLCDENPFEFAVVPADELPTTSDEYGQKVMTEDEVMLYGRKEGE